MKKPHLVGAVDGQTRRQRSQIFLDVRCLAANVESMRTAAWWLVFGVLTAMLVACIVAQQSRNNHADAERDARNAHEFFQPPAAAQRAAAARARATTMMATTRPTP
jgi:hypothetical protein